MMTPTWLRRAALVLVVGSVGAFVGGCSSSSESDSGNGGDAGNQGTDAGNGGNDAGNQGMDSGTGGNDAGQDAGNGGTDAGNGNDAGNGSDAGQDAGLTVLTVHNYFSWCTVSINGSAFSTTDPLVATVAPGLIPLEAQAASNTFILGDWYHTEGDLDGGGDPGSLTGGVYDGGTSHTAVQVGATPACVFICCPFRDGSGCAGVTDPCP